MTPLEQMKALAKIENKRLLSLHGGRTPNFGIYDQRVKCGGPRMSEIARSKPAQRMLRLAEQGYTAADVCRIMALPREKVRRTAARYQIKFKERT